MTEFNEKRLAWWRSEGKACPGSDEFLAEHGISREVWEARPYVFYDPDSLAPVRAEYERLSDGQRRFAAMIANGGRNPRRTEHPECRLGGYLIMRHVPPGLESFDKVYAEIRPDVAVATSAPEFHYHGPRPYPPHVEVDAETGRPLNPETGRPLPRKNIHSEEWARKGGHLARTKYGDDHGNGRGDLDAVHSHQNIAKYVFIPSGRVTQELEVESGPPRERRVRDKTDSVARRIDIHPLAVGLLESASRVYFGIEGCLKADAILTAGGAVFSVPSVTLWDAGELDTFAGWYLNGKEVVIVPDADWSTKNEVLAQAMLCRSFLRNMGLSVCIAAPPVESGHKGVDDFLGAGGSLDELVVFGREPAHGIVDWLEEHLPRDSLGRRPRTDRVVRDAAAIEGLGLHSGDDGRCQMTIQKLARVVQVEDRKRRPAEYVSLAEQLAQSDDSRTPLHYEAAKRAIQSLADCAAVEISGSLETRRNRHGEIEWADGEPPTFIVTKELRSRKTRPRTLGDSPRVARYNAAYEALEARGGHTSYLDTDRTEPVPTPVAEELSKWLVETGFVG